MGLRPLYIMLILTVLGSTLSQVTVTVKDIQNKTTFDFFLLQIYIFLIGII